MLSDLSRAKPREAKHLLCSIGRESRSLASLGFARDRSLGMTGIGLLAFREFLSALLCGLDRRRGPDEIAP
jgi:hypothetical protein